MELEKIKQCKACPLHKYRKNIVIGRGTIPADILFIGEAPGKSEDILGSAFIGRSGKLLDKMLYDAGKLSRIHLTTCSHKNFNQYPKNITKDLLHYYITNTVLCRPTDRRHGENRQPTKAEVCKCTKNIMAIYRMVKPRFIIFIGKVAEKYYKKEFPYSIKIDHPAYLLRGGGNAHPNYINNIRKLSEVFQRIKK